MLWFPAELGIRPAIQNASVPFTYKPKSLQDASPFVPFSNKHPFVSR